MDYDELVAKVIELLQREKRLPYRSLKRRFDVDDDYIEDLKIELIEAKRLAIDENDPADSPDRGWRLRDRRLLRLVRADLLNGPSWRCLKPQCALLVAPPVHQLGVICGRPAEADVEHFPIHRDTASRMGL